MMLISELLGESALIKKSPLWNRECETLTELDMQLFARSHYATRFYSKACRELDNLSDKLWEATMQSRVNMPRTLFFERPDVRISLDELNTWLECTSVERRQAILFGLEQNTEVEDLVRLTWSGVRRLHELTPLAKEVVLARPRHIRLDYLFWERLPNGASAPLFGLAETVLEVSQGLGWDRLKKLYTKIIPIDAVDQATRFSERLSSQLNLRISH